MEFIAYLGTDKENWGQVTGLINRGEWDKIILVKNKASDSFPHVDKPVEVVEVDSSKPLLELKDEIMNKIKDKLNDFDVALSIASGSGKEHMALISAILSIPSGLRLVAFTKKGVEYIN